MVSSWAGWSGCTSCDVDGVGMTVFLSLLLDSGALPRLLVDPGVELSFPVQVWSTCRCSFVSCLPWAMRFAPFPAFSVVNILGSISGGALS